MHPTRTPFKLRSEQLEVLQGDTYATIDCRRVESVYYNAGWMTVRYKVTGEVVLNCTGMELFDIKYLLHTLEIQRNRNRDLDQLLKKRDAGSIPLSIF